MHVGVELEQDSTCSVTLTQGDFAKNLQPLPATPKLWGFRRQLPSPVDVHLCQRELGALCWFATVSRPDTCARLARIDSGIN